MANNKQLPLQSSTAHNSAAGAGAVGGGGGKGKKTIEEVYQKKTQLEHILLRPDTYIGSVEKHTQTLWVFEDGEMVHRPVTYVPGLYKIFDEILVNAGDNKQRDPSMDSVKVEIDAEQNLISVYNNGDGVPVEIHQEEGVYVPEMIFGHLLTSSNYDDNVKKTTGGRNGYGAKLTNIFSTEFVIQTADGKRQKKYKQVFLENMGKKSEPSITKCREGENWTKVSFKPDLAKFNMTHLEDDVVALMKKRVVDLAGTLGKSVKVELNGTRVPVKTFSDYVDLYLKSANKTRAQPLPRIMEKVNDRWEICVSLSEGQFQQVSFVNGINTIKGGTHVEHVTSQIANHVTTAVNKKNKNANLKAHNVKNHLWVFVNALVDNPAFDSQTKETLTTRQGSFGSKCELSEEFLKKVGKSGIVEILLSWADFKLSKELKKTDGTKKQNITGIPKLDDANDAGGKHSEKCTLILTEGDSAKALAVAGVSELGRDYYGVFPLRGKLLNVREATHQQIMQNAEIQNIKQILGLQQGKEYDSVKGLRYGHLMIMTDQDHDGSHIKGLLINFIHSFWPSLLRVKGFMVEFITPIVKASHRNGTILPFYTMPEYEAWKERLNGNVSGWSIKYYKGLGTSTAKEGKEYFRAIDKHKKSFIWEDEKDGEAIELAFSKKKIEARKNWLRQFEHGTYLDHKDKEIKYSDFVNKELILFSRADLQRSIPSMVDGLKPGQRKILFCAFKRNFVKEAKVAQFSGYVSEHSAYHHGEQSLAGTIVGMAQDYVGSNNINLFQPNGQFGTRNEGGKDSASARYIYTCLSPITRFLFPKDDDLLLDYLNEDGQSIEPAWYVPIIPTVLVNGSEGIGTGWSSYVPNYNPRDIIANVRRLLNDEPMQPMDPWYKGFKGSIEKSAEKETGVTYTISGIIEEVDNTTVRITELPIRSWTFDYNKFLESMLAGNNDKFKEPFIQEKRAHNDDVSVHFEVILSEENMMVAKQEGLEKKFKLTTTISTSNMHLFDANGAIKKYDTPEQILEDFFHLRLHFYEKRKKVLVDNLELDLLKLDNKVRFILAVVHGEIIVNNRKRAELFLELHQKGFTPFPKKTKGIDAAIAGATVEAEENEEESAEMVKGGIKASDYEYLLSMSIGTLTLERVQELCAEKDRQERELALLKSTSHRALWMRDLDAFEKQLDEQDRKDAEAEKTRLENRSKINAGGVSKKAPKKPRKNNAAKGSTSMASDPTVGSSPTATDAAAGSTSTATDTVGMPKPKGGKKKAAAKKKTTVVDSDEDDELVELKDRLAAYNLDSSPDQPSMETEEAGTKKAVPSKRAAARKSKSSLTISDDDNDTDGEALPAINEDGDDEDFEMVEAPKAKGKKAAGAGRKPAANAKAKAATTTNAGAGRKRGGAQGKSLMNQKLITEVLKPAENASPEKKVRKMRASPFNKKSGSVLGRAGGSLSSGNLEAEMNEVPVARNLPKRESRAKIMYVESGSEEEDEEEEPATEDSDFEEEDD